MAKATHIGECQWCGSRQKLPGGLLSKHGYTVEDGWFEGVCLGAKHLPYEQSRDLIEKSIDWAKAHRAEFVTERDQVLRIDPKKTDQTWKEIYNPFGFYFWVHGTMTPSAGGGKFHHEFIPDPGITLESHQRRTNSGKLVDKVKEGNEQYAEHLTGKIKKVDRYIAEQKRRFDDWKLLPLEPVQT